MVVFVIKHKSKHYPCGECAASTTRVDINNKMAQMGQSEKKRGDEKEVKGGDKLSENVST